MDLCIYFERCLLITAACLLMFGRIWCDVENLPTGLSNDSNVEGDGELPQSVEFPLEVDSLTDTVPKSIPLVTQDEFVLSTEPSDDIMKESVEDNDLPIEEVPTHKELGVGVSENSAGVVREDVQGLSDDPDEGKMGQNTSAEQEGNQSHQLDINISKEPVENPNSYMGENGTFSNENITDANDNITLSNDNITVSNSNLTVSNDNITVSNSTHDPNTTTTSKPVIRWPCNPLTNISIAQLVTSDSESSNSSVIIINNETMLTNLISAMNRTKVCGLLLFYSPYCEFCTTLSPLYNAVGRSYSDIIVIASDAQHVMGVSAKYGIVGIPTILLFHSGKAVAKYNRSRTASDFHEFILQLTGVTPNVDLNITQDDRVGPLITTLKESRDYYLIFSICFIIFVLLKGLAPLIKDSTLRVYRCIGTLFVRPKVD